MYMIQIEEHKLDKMSEYAEKMLKYGGKLMSCIEEMSEESGMGHRGGRYGSDYGSRYSDYGSRGSMGYRDDEEWDDDDDMMGQRRGGRGRRRDSRGRYM